jgi:hypothetical protein
MRGKACRAKCLGEIIGSVLPKGKPQISPLRYPGRLVPKGRLNLAQDASPTSVNLFGVFFSNLPQNRHPERSASQILSRDTPLGREVEGPRGALILLMPLAPFQPPKPAPGGPATVRRICTDLGMEDDPVHEKVYPRPSSAYRRRDSVLGLG